MVSEGEIRFGFEIDTQGLDRLKDDLREAVRFADMEVAKALLIDSRAYVPILTGALVGSGRIEELPGIDDSVHIVRVVYGRTSGDIVYAKKQHDDILNHPQLGFKGAALYLKRTYDLNIAFYLEWHRITLNSVLEGMGYA